MTRALTMLHLTALFRADTTIQAQGTRLNAQFFSAADRASFGMDVHAGVSETSAMLAVRPDLVTPLYKTLPSQAGHRLEELQEIAVKPDWQGYVSSPGKATAAYGRALEAWWSDGFADLILRAVRGENLRAHAREPEQIPGAPMFGRMVDDERAFAVKLEEWLAQRQKK